MRLVHPLYLNIKGAKDMKQSKKIKLNVTAFFFMAPALLAILSIMVYPLIRGISIGFTDRLFTYDKYSFVGFKNYVDMTKDPLFWSSLYNSIKLTTLTVIGTMGLGLALALLLNSDEKYIAFFRGILFIPWVLPSMVIASTFRWIYNDFYGYINYILVKYKIIPYSVNILADTKLAWIGILIPIIWCSYPFVMMVFLASLQSIDKSFYEAAQIDGANRWQLFRYITIPALKPTFIIVAILQIIWEFSAFDLVYLLTKGGPGDATLTLSLYIYRKAFGFKTVGYASALATVMFIILFSFTMIYFWVLRRNDNYEK